MKLNRSVGSARIKPNRSVVSAGIKPNRSVVSAKIKPNRSVESARIKPNRSVVSAGIKPNRSVVSTKNQRRKVDLPCEAEERQIVRQKLRLDLISIVSNIICFFYAVNTFFLYFVDSCISV